MFLYADVQWPTYAYGALAGINAGDSFNYATVFGSRTSNIVNIEETSNIGIPGIWIFKIGEGMHISVMYIYVCIRVYVYAKQQQLVTVKMALPSKVESML